MTTTAEEIELLTATEAAALLKRKRATLLRYRRAWGITAIQVGRVWMFRRSDLAAWIEENAQKGPAY